jgi:hypothetical protein
MNSSIFAVVLREPPFEDASPPATIVGSSLRADDPPWGRFRALVREAAQEIYRDESASALPAREFARAWWIAA